MTDLLLILLFLAVYAALHGYLRFCAHLAGGATHRPATIVPSERDNPPTGVRE
ncbi:MAG: hypothetical protein MUD17_05505 [Gemmatimonadaceae bacterium]|jgi:hypothetical protein|nr:hypothetical protein [Gemmatimonadaceae bacterium]